MANCNHAFELFVNEIDSLTSIIDEQFTQLSVFDRELKSHYWNLTTSGAHSTAYKLHSFGGEKILPTEISREKSLHENVQAFQAWNTAVFAAVKAAGWKRYVSNAFSLQMVKEDDLHRLRFSADVKPDDLSGYESIVGHADTAAVIGVPMNRESVTLKLGDELLVAQLVGGRLPEGATTLPEGFSFRWVSVYFN